MQGKQVRFFFMILTRLCYQKEQYFLNWTTTHMMTSVESEWQKNNLDDGKENIFVENYLGMNNINNDTDQ